MTAVDHWAESCEFCESEEPGFGVMTARTLSKSRMIYPDHEVKEHSIAIPAVTTHRTATASTRYIPFSASTPHYPG